MVVSNVMQILGITLDKPFFRLALVEKTKKRSQILYLKTFPISDVEGVKQLYKAFTGKICSSISAKNLLIRELEFQSNTKKHLEQIIAFQADATSHLSETEVLSIPYIQHANKEKTNALLFTVLRSGIREILDTFGKMEIDPDSMTAAPLALITFLKWKIPHIQDAFIIDLGSDEWTCVCMDKGTLKKFHSISGGIESLLEALWEDRKKNLIPKEITGIAKQIDLLQLQSTLNSQLSSKMLAMRKELARVIYSFSNHFGQKTIFFTGRVDAFGQLQEFLEEAITDSVKPNLFEEIPKEEQKHATSIGIAIGFSEPSVQFLQDEFYPKKNWRKMGLSSIYLCAMSLLMALGLMGFSNYSFHANNRKMISSLQSTLHEWDQILEKEIFVTDKEEEILEHWEKATKKYTKEYAYILRCPKVAQVLSWIYQHPAILSAENDQDPIEIKSIRYQLISYPKIDSPKDPYVAKVEMEFQTASPLNARKFHEAIYQGEGWADNTQEIQWEVADQKYLISFYLKENNA